MKYEMFVLPCRHLPFVSYPYEAEIVRAELVREWAKNDLFKYSFGFLFSTHEPKDFSDYKVPIGDVIDGKLVTTKEIIISVASNLRRLPFTFDMQEAMHHLDPYYRILGLLPYWGEPRYYDLIKQRKTPRVLYGPHREGGLRPNQKRLVLLDDDKNFVFGPLQSA